MPTISVFFGIIIKMYREINSRHNLPHIHAEYQEYEAVISLDGELLKGELPLRKMKLVQAWIEIHQEDLNANWKLLSEGKEFFKIDPLR
jgi:hypothetical protein